MFKSKLLCLLISVYLLPCYALAQEDVAVAKPTVTIGGQIKPRGEFRNGFKTMIPDDADPAAFIEQRSRAILNFNDNTNNNSNYRYGGKLSLQDVRIFGATGQINKTDPYLAIHEAYGFYRIYEEYDGPYSFIDLKVGRQEINIYNARIMGNLDWAAQARSHDALRFDLNTEGDLFSLALAYNQDNNIPEPVKLTGNDYNPPSGFGADGGGLPNYKYMVMLYNDLKIWGFDVRILDIYLGWQRQPGDIANMNTFGFMPTLPLSDDFKLNAEAYIQTGEDRVGDELRAYMLNFSLNYKPNAKFNSNLGVDILSGTDADVLPGESNTFDPLFGTHHKFYGFMDYFYVGNANSQFVTDSIGTRSVGLTDIYLNATYGFAEHFSLRGDIHYFMSNAQLLENGLGSDEADNNLGTELDLTLNYKPTKNVTFTWGGSVMLPSESMGIIKAFDTTDPQFWTYLMVDITPSILFTGS